MAVVGLLEPQQLYAGQTEPRTAAVSSFLQSRFAAQRREQLRGRRWALWSGRRNAL